MFIDNKYTNWYKSIINRSHDRVLIGYRENHHIIPRCMGGGNEKTNIAILTAREHFICHYLLTKMVVGVNCKKMFNALNKMNQSKNTQTRHKLNSHLFQYLREGVSKYNTGKNNVMFGKTHTDEVKNLLSKLHTGKTLSKWHISRISESNTGVNNPFFGKTHTKETKDKMSKSWVDRVLISCPHCNKTGRSRGNMNRWHFDNCKYAI